MDANTREAADRGMTPSDLDRSMEPRLSYEEDDRHGSIDKAEEDNATSFLLLEHDDLPSTTQPTLTLLQLGGLYTSHGLSMWNSRSYEFASVLFTTSAYPETLTVASLRGISANLASLLLSPAVGRWCNRHPSRLRTLQICILLQRICICVACLGWIAIVQGRGVDQQHTTSEPDQPDSTRIGESKIAKHTITALLLALGMLEKLSAVGNLIVMERDWIPLLVTPSSKPPLHVLNASIKRIDLFCKLVAPLAISAFALNVGSLKVTSAFIAVMQTLTIVPEMLTARWVWSSCPSLQSARPTIHIEKPANARRASKASSLLTSVRTWIRSLTLYTTSPAFLPSLTWTLQPFSVLTLSASLTVYLLAAHFPLSTITAARTASTGVEIASTVLAPMLISWLSKRSARPSLGTEKSGTTAVQDSLILTGLYGLMWQLALLLPAVGALVYLPSGSTDPSSAFPFLSGVLFASLALSRLGPFAYSLVEQQIVQTTVPAESRVEFSGVEMALVSFAELARWTFTGVFGAPQQFKGVAVASFVVLAMGLAAFWAWSRRWRTATKHSAIDLVVES